MLKIANPAFTATELEAQDAAADLIAAAEPTLRVAVPLPNLAGEKCTAITGLLDGTAYVRLLRFLPGGTLVDSGYLSAGGGRGPGRCGGPGQPGAGRLQPPRVGPRTAVGPAVRRTTSWRNSLSHVTDRAQRATVDRRRARPGRGSRRWPTQLPRQAAHLDLTDANVVVTRTAAGAHPDGVIDFGDLSDTWAVSELAITAVLGARPPGRDPDVDPARRRAFHAVRPLTAAEVEALWPLLVLRTAVLIVSGAQQAALDPDNAYVTEQSDAEMRMFEQATSVPIDVMTALIKADLGLAAAPGNAVVDAPLIAGLDPAVGGDARPVRHVRRLRLAFAPVASCAPMSRTN